MRSLIWAQCGRTISCSMTRKETCLACCRFHCARQGLGRYWRSRAGVAPRRLYAVRPPHGVDWRALEESNDDGPRIPETTALVAVRQPRGSHHLPGSSRGARYRVFDPGCSRSEQATCDRAGRSQAFTYERFSFIRNMGGMARTEPHDGGGFAAALCHGAPRSRDIQPVSPPPAWSSTRTTRRDLRCTSRTQRSKLHRAITRYPWQTYGNEILSHSRKENACTSSLAIECESNAYAAIEEWHASKA